MCFLSRRPWPQQPCTYRPNEVWSTTTVQGGFWMYDGKFPLTLGLASTTAIASPGAGGSLGWADPRTRLAVAYCHNRMSGEDGASLVGNAIRTALSIT